QELLTEALHKNALKEGDEAFARGNYSVAIAQYEEAQEIRSSPAITERISEARRAEAEQRKQAEVSNFRYACGSVGKVESWARSCTALYNELARKGERGQAATWDEVEAVAQCEEQKKKGCIECSIAGGFFACKSLAPLEPATRNLACIRRGEQLFEAIVRRYPQTQMTWWGWGSSASTALILPRREWNRLSKKDKVSLAGYVEYKVGGSSWTIIVGDPVDSHDLTIDKTVVQSDDLWESGDPCCRGEKGSVFFGSVPNCG
ncbi:MAG: hypothetical protein V3U28_01355, partial [Candidatus Acidoferrales bacterium]